MQSTAWKKLLSCILCIVLIAAMALCTTGCNDSSPSTGEKVSFTFIAVDAEGKASTFQITTDKKLVGEALMEEGLIAGEAGPYGLYVKTVNGITLDYDKDGKYWSFYVGEDYALTGVDQTEITDGAVYSFKAESAS